jgi:transposase
MEQIATQLGVSQKTISLDLQGVVTKGNNPPRPKGGRPKRAKQRPERLALFVLALTVLLLWLVMASIA